MADLQSQLREVQKRSSDLTKGIRKARKKAVMEEKEQISEEEKYKELIKEIKRNPALITINTECVGFPEFSIAGRTVTYSGKDGQSTQLLGAVPIAQKSTFSIKVLKAKNRHICIGVIDEK